VLKQISHKDLNSIHMLDSGLLCSKVINLHWPKASVARESDNREGDLV
jgi:catalase (peroxidase I)